MDEPLQTLNGHRLSVGQAMAVRVAIEHFAMWLNVSGDDVSQLYLARLQEVREIMASGPPVEVLCESCGWLLRQEAALEEAERIYAQPKEEPEEMQPLIISPPKTHRMPRGGECPAEAECPGCHSHDPASTPEACPFAVELHDDHVPCACCDHCRRQCARDV